MGFIERIMLSVGVSIAIVPLIGLGLNFTPWKIRLDPIVIALIFFTWVMFLVAHYRRASLSSENQLRVPFVESAGRIRREFLPSGENKVDRFLSIILTVVVLAALIMTVYVIFAAPKEDEHFTEFFILGENRTTSGYPSLIIAGNSYPVYIGVGNHENGDISYTIETWILKTEFDNVTNISTIRAMDANDRLSFTLAQNKTTVIPYNLSINQTGYNQVEFLLFKEIIPNSKVTGYNRINASYRNVHIWVTVR
jgi:uncharacterized membrane protein